MLLQDTVSTKKYVIFHIATLLSVFFAIVTSYLGHLVGQLLHMHALLLVGGFVGVIIGGIFRFALRDYLVVEQEDF